MVLQTSNVHQMIADIHLCVSHEECRSNVLHACLDVETSEIGLEVWDSVALPQCDLEHLKAADEGGQPRQTLLATSTDSNQKSISTRSLKNPVDAQNVRYGILQEKRLIITTALLGNLSTSLQGWSASICFEVGERFSLSTRRAPKLWVSGRRCAGQIFLRQK